MQPLPDGRGSVGSVRALAFFLALLAAGCGRQPSRRPVERIAILRFENLGADSGQDWIGRAFSEVLAEELAGAPGVYVVPTLRLQATNQAMGPRPAHAPGISASRAAALAEGANRLVYGEFSVRGNQLEARLTVEDSETGKMTGVFSANGTLDEVVAVAGSLAGRISGGASGYTTASVPALRAWVSALETTDASAAERDIEQAIGADAGFPAPYRALAEMRARRRDTAGAVSLLETALARGKFVSPAERVRIEGDLAALRNDAAGRERALAALTNLNPNDPAAWRARAENALARREYGEAANAYRKAAEIEPDNAPTWNQLGYAAAWSGDLNAAMDALRRYQALRPAEANPLDSMGDVNYLHGRLHEAEGFYLEAAGKDPNFLAGLALFKAALARLMTGDVAAADTLARRYLDSRSAAKDTVAEYRAAEWDWAAGRRKAACTRMEAFARGAENGPLRELAPGAWAHLAVWYLTLGDRPAGARLAEHAVAAAGSSTSGAALLARFLAQPPAPPAEWAARADRMFPNGALPELKLLVLAYALLLDKQFEAAVPLAKQLEESGTSALDSVLPVLRAWTLIETGHTGDAAPFLRWNPLPQSAGMGSFWAFTVPRIFYLRGVSAAAAGQAEEAKKQFRIFLQLSGADPLLWGEEQKAKAAL